MDIRDIQSTGTSSPQPPQGARENGSTQRSAGQATTPGPDCFTASPRAQALQAARQDALAMPDVRQDRVDEMRQRLADGSLVPDPQRIARALLDQQVV